jgi:hypothetical protein
MLFHSRTVGWTPTLLHAIWRYMTLFETLHAATLTLFGRNSDASIRWCYSSLHDAIRHYMTLLWYYSDATPDANWTLLERFSAATPTLFWRYSTLLDSFFLAFCSFCFRCNPLCLGAIYVYFVPIIWVGLTAMMSHFTKKLALLIHEKFEDFETHFRIK